MFDFIHGYIETWGTGGGSFRNLYTQFLEELLTHPDIKEGPKAWKNEDFKIVEENLPIIKESAEIWKIIAETLKSSTEEHKDDCINNVDLSKLQDHALRILAQEKLLFNNLLKLKI